MQYLVLTLLLVASVEADDTEPWTVLPEDMEQFCPSKRVCQRTPPSTTNRLDVPEMFMHCCKDCSCEETCGHTEPCCFPAMDERVNSARLRQSCIRASTHRYNDGAASFYMVTEESDLKNADSNDTDRTRCGDVNVAPWGSMYPVMSNETGLIYKNIVCAERDEANDLVYLDAYFYCSWRIINTDRQFFLAQYVYESTYKGPQCGIGFFPPKHLRQQIEKELCYKDVVRTCGNEMYQYPFNMSVAEVRDACESGFYSPFDLLNTVYANVFCFMCNTNAETDFGRVRCEPQTDSFGPKPRALTMLLSRNFYTGIADVSLLNAPLPNRNVACEDSGSLVSRTNCRTVHCPTGQMYDKAGSCVLVFSELDKRYPVIHLVLTPREAITVADVPVSKRLDTWLKSPWPKDWIVYAVFSKEITWSNSSNSGQIHVYLNYKRKYIKTEELMATMTNAIRKPFQICLRPGHCALLDQQFVVYNVVNYNGVFVPEWYYRSSMYPKNKNHTLLEKTPDTFQMLRYNIPDIRAAAPPIQFGKTFLCTQVELKASEYEYLPNLDILIYKPLNRVLFMYEFDIVRDSSGTNHFRICLEDSGLKLLTNHAKGWLYGDDIVKLILGSLSLTLLAWSL